MTAAHALTTRDPAPSRRAGGSTPRTVTGPWRAALALAALALCVAGAAAGPFGVAAAATGVGEVARLRGVAAVSRDGRATVLEVGSPIYESDVVATGPRGRLQIRFADGSVLSLGSETSFEIAHYRLDDAGGRAVDLNALAGIFRSVVAAVPGPSRYRVELINAVASVRSTSWMFELATDHCAVFVGEGVVQVAHTAPRYPEPVTLTAGGGTDVYADQPPAAPMPWGAKRIASFRDRTAIE